MPYMCIKEKGGNKNTKAETKITKYKTERLLLKKERHKKWQGQTISPGIKIKQRREGKRG